MTARKGNELAVREGGQLAKIDYSDEQIQLMKATVAQGLSDPEFQLFVNVCKHTGLDPFVKQIYAIKRRTKVDDKWVERMTIQVGIDGLRLVASRTGAYAGQVGPEWCGEDGIWKDVWLASNPPAAARVGVVRKDAPGVVTYGVVRWKSYVQTGAGGTPNSMWAKMDAEQLAKCAEAQALRKAFPNELSAVHTQDEMAHEDTPIREEHSNGIKSRNEERVGRALSEAMVEGDEPALEDEGSIVDELNDDGDDTVTFDAFKELLAKAKPVLGRSFVKESPSGSKKYWFVDQTTLKACGIASSVKTQEAGERAPQCDDATLAALYREVARELAEKQAVAA